VTLPGDTSRSAIGAGAALLAILVACASPDTVSRRDPVEHAIESAEAFLQRRDGSLDPLMTYVLARLERRYGLTWTAAQRRQVLSAARSTPQLRLFGRLVDPAARPDAAALDTITNASDRLILTALYCHELGTPPDDWLAAFADKPGADVSHGALALRWLLENGCISDAQAEPLRRRFVSALDAQAAQTPTTDLGIEAMAMLDYLGASDRIEHSWMSAIVGAQHADGGWGEHPADPSNDHTTALALWVLLAGSGRPAVDVPWIAQPPTP
jgi:hypothetical protein